MSAGPAPASSSAAGMALVSAPAASSSSTFASAAAFASASARAKDSGTGSITRAPGARRASAASAASRRAAASVGFCADAKQSDANTSNAAFATATPCGMARNTSYEPYSLFTATARRNPLSANARVISLTNACDRVVGANARRAARTRSRTPAAGARPFAGGFESVASATTCVMLAPEPGKPLATAIRTGAHSKVYSASSALPLAADSNRREHASHVPQTRRETGLSDVAADVASPTAGAGRHVSGVVSPKCRRMPARLHPRASLAKRSSASVLFFCVSRASRESLPT